MTHAVPGDATYTGPLRAARAVIPHVMMTAALADVLYIALDAEFTGLFLPLLEMLKHLFQSFHIHPFRYWYKKHSFFY